MRPDPEATATERAGIEALLPEDGPLVLAIGVFDGIHVGHRSLVEQLVAEARRRDARPAVLTFESHPDEFLAGAAPPLLVDPTERIRLLAALGVELVVVQHFDAALRRTPYDAFVRGILARTPVRAFVMTPDAAFGRDRGGSPETVARLGAELGFEVVVAEPLLVDGAKVSSSAIRALIAAGGIAAAERLLGRPYEATGDRRGDLVAFPFRVALPPAGERRILLDGREVRALLRDDGIRLPSGVPGRDGRVRVGFR